jgi:cellulose synthase/poly-beta-1,6-N-acetylglucosamine synthase-like glycosyltransferase
VTLQGQSALGLGAGFRGNGMCISMRGLRRVPWKSYGLVEDMEYSWSVRVAGGKVAFLPDLLVKGQMVGQGGRAAASQRRRWEAGRQEIRRRFFLPLLRSRFLNPIHKLTSLLELIMPPMVPLLMLCLGLLIANGTLLLVANPGSAVAWGLAGFSVLMVVAITVHAISPFFLYELSWSYLLILPYLPLYALWKCVISLQGRPKQWVRTPREQPANR